MRRGDEILTCKTNSDLRVVHSHRSSRSCQASPWLWIANGGQELLYERRLTTIPYSGKFSRAQFSRITNKHARKKFPDFYFRDKVTISDHTPYNFPRGNGDPQRVFQRQNDSKTLARLSKRVGRCRGRTAMPKKGS